MTGVEVRTLSSVWSKNDCTADRLLSIVGVPTYFGVNNRFDGLDIHEDKLEVTEAVEGCGKTNKC